MAADFGETRASVAAPAALFASIARLHIVAIAVLGLFTFGWLFTGQYPWLLAGLAGFDWFVVNLLNRIVDLPEDRTNDIRGTDFVARHQRPLFWVTTGTLLLSLLVTAWLLPGVTALRVGYHALGMAYNWPLLPGRRRIKTLYFWKNTASALGFLLTVFGYPLAAALTGSGPPLLASADPAMVLLCVAFFFPFELSYEVIYDLRDVDGDRQAQVRSYPVAHGSTVAVRIIDGLLVASAVPLVAGYALGLLPWRVFVMIAAPALQLLIYKRALRRGIRAGDCIGLTWLGAGLLLAYHLWILAGLPGVGN